MTWPSGSFHDALRREPLCLIRMCDALTLSDDEDILVFFLCLFLSVRSARSSVEIEDGFFLFLSESMFTIEVEREREVFTFVNNRAQSANVQRERERGFGQANYEAPHLLKFFLTRTNE